MQIRVLVSTLVASGLVLAILAGHTLAAPASQSAQPAPAAAPVVDINRAGAGELEALPGIGPSLAGAIVRHRTEKGAFATVDDLAAVPGVGPKLVEKLKPRLTAAAVTR